VLLIGCGLVAAYASADAWAQAVVPASATSPTLPVEPPPVPAIVKVPSMMFTADQITDINRALDRAPAVVPHGDEAAGTPIKATAVQILSLSALLFTDAAHWAVWVNGVRLVPGTVSDGYRVVGVSKGMVEFEIDGPPPQRVRLRPHESFQVGTHPGESGTIQ
jgi:hypothetical protein